MVTLTTVVSSRPAIAGIDVPTVVVRTIEKPSVARHVIVVAWSVITGVDVPTRCTTTILPVDMPLRQNKGASERIEKNANGGIHGLPTMTDHCCLFD
jgi:hypothetical protein